jgi:hypothetical protein
MMEYIPHYLEAKMARQRVMNWVHCLATPTAMVHYTGKLMLLSKIKKERCLRLQDGNGY